LTGDACAEKVVGSGDRREYHAGNGWTGRLQWEGADHITGV